MMTEAVLFDLDGTLVDSLPLIFRTLAAGWADRPVGRIDEIFYKEN
jgi:beta-phosphoglucomutase-like phosphatase (HAD superfamily)